MLAGWQRELASHRRLQPGRRRRADRSARPAQSRTDARRSTASASSRSTTARRCRRARSSPRRSAPTPSEPNFHNNYQDPEAFLAAGGRRGRQYVPLTDGTYFINRWFATVEMIPKTVVPIGYVGVVVSYYGRLGRDLSGDGVPPRRARGRGRARRVGAGRSARASTPSTPTPATSSWCRRRTSCCTGSPAGRETHRYDESLRSIDLVTKDAYEPLLPLSVVVHIDYQKAPSVIQRFGDVKKLITQTLDPMLSAYFRDVAHKKTMLELLHERDVDPGARRATSCGSEFREFDIECVDVLIGKPDTAEAGGKIETLLEQLRLRQLSIEQIETFERQRAAADKQRGLERSAGPGRQADRADQLADPDPDRREPGRGRSGPGPQAGRADGRHRAGREPAAHVWPARAKALACCKPVWPRPRCCCARSARSATRGCTPCWRRPKSCPTAASRWCPSACSWPAAVAKTATPPAPSQGLLGTLISLLVAEKSGFQPAGDGAFAGLEEMTERMTRDAMESMQQAVGAHTNDPAVTGAPTAKVIKHDE